ncbi:hypothetical protein KGQ20_05555 [Catenulispora sp. NF23]|uniref:hypothetical protein n=1 Tax=Catenulispora pinistramenti TaxID=2705254 RepID=UPI001BA853A2|nr:hypothetical protein [Catenulispora pinistramenti]MBS2532232.1 hypothetical protein [Catenulispora pinistramenti]
MTSTNSTAATTTRTVAEAAAEPVRLHADHTAVKRLGNWSTAERFEVRARRGSVVLDLRSPHLPAGELVVDLDLDRAMVKLLLPDDAVVDQRGIAWSGSGKVKDGVGRQNARNGELFEAADGVRRVRLTGRIHSGEVRVARGGVAMLAAMFSREYVEDVKKARREGAWPTVDDPTRASKNA